MYETTKYNILTCAMYLINKIIITYYFEKIQLEIQYYIGNNGELYTSENLKRKTNILWAFCFKNHHYFEIHIQEKLAWGNLFFNKYQI